MTNEEKREIANKCRALIVILSEPDNVYGWEENVTATIENIALHLFPICSDCGERHPQVEEKIIANTVRSRFESH